MTTPRPKSLICFFDYPAERGAVRVTKILPGESYISDDYYRAVIVLRTLRQSNDYDSYTLVKNRLSSDIAVIKYFSERGYPFIASGTVFFLRHSDEEILQMIGNLTA